MIAVISTVQWVVIGTLFLVIFCFFVKFLVMFAQMLYVDMEGPLAAKLDIVAWVGICILCSYCYYITFIFVSVFCICFYFGPMLESL